MGKVGGLPLPPQDRQLQPTVKKFPNRGLKIFPEVDLYELANRPWLNQPNIGVDYWAAWVEREVRPHIRDWEAQPAPVQPEPEVPAKVEPAPQDENERWFREFGAYEFEGITFTGLIDDNKIPGFIAQEITNAFEYEDQAQSTRYLNPKTLGWFYKTGEGGFRKVRVVDERGFYTLIMRAKRTPVTVRFQEWVTFEVLPSIRKTGSYSMKPQLEAPRSSLSSRF
jgi:hypothetical protein